MPSLLDIIMRAQPATEGDISDSLATAGDNPLLREFLRLQGRRVRDAVTAPRDAYRGDLQVFDPATGHVSDEAIERAGGMAGLAMTGGLGGVAARAGETVLGSGPIRAYHGSPHSFDKFSTKAIGTGEGAQAYGHGLYFAENEAVAKGYRDALSMGRSTIGGVPADETNPLHLAAAYMHEGGDRAGALTALQRDFSGPGTDPVSVAAAEARRLIEAGKPIPKLEPNKGHMYEVGINADPSRLLDWDAPLAQQSESVRGAFRDVDPSMRGSEAYRRLSPDPVSASSMLQDAGVQGIRYLDAGSRGADGRTGTRNLVVFNDQLVDILRKYGIAGLAALGAGGGSVANLGMMPPEGVTR